MWTGGIFLEQFHEICSRESVNIGSAGVLARRVRRLAEHILHQGSAALFSEPLLYLTKAKAERLYKWLRRMWLRVFWRLFCLVLKRFLDRMKMDIPTRLQESAPFSGLFGSFSGLFPKLFLRPGFWKFHF